MRLADHVAEIRQLLSKLSSSRSELLLSSHAVLIFCLANLGSISSSIPFATVTVPWPGASTS